MGVQRKLHRFVLSHSSNYFMLLIISFSCYSVALFKFIVTSTSDKHGEFRAGWNHFGSLLPQFLVLKCDHCILAMDPKKGNLQSISYFCCVEVRADVKVHADRASPYDNTVQASWLNPVQREPLTITSIHEHRLLVNKWPCHGHFPRDHFTSDFAIVIWWKYFSSKFLLIIKYIRVFN